MYSFGVRKKWKAHLENVEVTTMSQWKDTEPLVKATDRNIYNQPCTQKYMLYF